MNQFQKFLRNLRNYENFFLIESIKEGYSAVFENDLKQYRTFPDHLKNDPELAASAVKEYPFNYMYVPEEIKRNNPEMAMTAVMNGTANYPYVPEEIRENNFEIAKIAIENSHRRTTNSLKWSLYNYMPPKLIEERPELLEMLVEKIIEYSKNPHTLGEQEFGFYKDIPQALRERSPKLAHEAIKANMANNWWYVPENIKTNPVIEQERAKFDDLKQQIFGGRKKWLKKVQQQRMAQEIEKAGKQVGMKITRKSPVSGKKNTFVINATPEQLRRWQEGELIQRAMPNLSPDEREFIMTGFTPEEWEMETIPLDHMPEQEQDPWDEI